MVVIVVIVEKYQLSHQLAVVGTPHVLVSILGQCRRSDAIRRWRGGGRRRRASEAGHFWLRSVEVLIGGPADVQNGGLGPQGGFLGGHERPAHFPDVLCWHIKCLCAFVLSHLPPVLVGLLHQHIALSLPDSHHLVFGLVLVVIFHLNVDLSRSDGQPLSVSHVCGNKCLPQLISNLGLQGSSYLTEEDKTEENHKLLIFIFFKDYKTLSKVEHTHPVNNTNPLLFIWPGYPHPTLLLTL